MHVMVVPMDMTLKLSGDKAMTVIRHNEQINHKLKFWLDMYRGTLSAKPDIHAYTTKLLFYQSPTRHSDYTVTTTVM